MPTATTASATPPVCMVVSFSPNQVSAMMLTATSWITADRLKADDMPKSRTSLSMIRLPAE